MQADGRTAAGPRAALGLVLVLFMHGAAAAQSAGPAPPAASPGPPPQTNWTPSKPIWDIAGRWTWTAKCTTGVWTGGWSIVVSGPGWFSGGYTGSNIADVGVIVNGRVKGNTMTFLHKFKDILGTPHDDRVRGTLKHAGDGLKVEGTSGDKSFSCTFVATK